MTLVDPKDSAGLQSRPPDAPAQELVALRARVAELEQALAETHHELRRVKDFLERTGTVAGVGGWEIDMESRRLTWTEAARRIHEVEGPIAPEISAISAFYPPDARRRLLRALDECMATGRPWELELPFVTARGRNLWVRAAGTAERVDGRVVRLVGAVQDITERKMLEHDMRRRARHDDLTGLVNRGTFDAALAEAYTRRRSEVRTWLLALDLDGFKRINDGCGHAVGDQVLRDVAVVLERAAGERDLAARMGGDEFSILLRGRSRAAAIEVAEHIARELRRLDFSFEGRHYRVEASMGLVPIAQSFIGPDQVAAAADGCCRQAKTHGEHGLLVWDPAQATAASAEPRWVQRIEWALEHGGIHLYAQRLINLATDDLELRCEVLPRLVEPDGRLTLPHAFLDAAERFRFAARIDLAVLEGVIQALLPFESVLSLSAAALISLNLSSQLLSDRESQAALLARLDDAPWAAGLLAFEIDETTALANPVAAVELARDLQMRGALVALDNFGGGASALNRLRDLSPDLLKLDARLVQALPADPMAQAMVRGLRDVARVLGVPVVAKGIESSAALVAARALGLELGQGFHLHTPDPLSAILARRLVSPEPPPPEAQTSAR